jgi:hypothetical protein
MDAKWILVMAGVMIFVVLSSVPIGGLPKLPTEIRVKRGFLVMVALAFILAGAYWR